MDSPLYQSALERMKALQRDAAQRQLNTQRTPSGASAQTRAETMGRINRSLNETVPAPVGGSRE